MEIIEAFIVLVLVFYSNYLISLFNIKNRKAIKKTNIKLEELRTIPVKTLEQQKDFINIRYNKQSFKFSWSSVFMFVLYTIKFVLLFIMFRKLISFWPWDILWWHAVLFIFFFPMIVNYILSLFGLQKKGVKIF